MGGCITVANGYRGAVSIEPFATVLGGSWRFTVNADIATRDSGGERTKRIVPTDVDSSIGAGVKARRPHAFIAGCLRIRSITSLRRACGRDLYHLESPIDILSWKFTHAENVIACLVQGRFGLRMFVRDLSRSCFASAMQNIYEYRNGLIQN
jgi:hypothetical protein